MKFKILTPNTQYNGVTEGVPFASGVGYTDDVNVKNKLVNNYGYSYKEEKPATKSKATAEAAKPKKASGK